MIRVAMLSYWHVHAKDYAEEAKSHPEVEIVAVWDEIPERGQEEAEKLDVPFYESLDDLLGQSVIDGVIVDVPTNQHTDVITRAAAAGKHIFTEKVLAPTVAEVNKIMDIVEEKDVKLTVSLPRLNDGYTLAIQEILKQQKLGDLTLVRVRLSHNGAIKNWLPTHFYNLEQCQGGALIDLGCHPMYLVRLFLGMPESLSAHYGYVTGKEVEDNAVAILNYPNGAKGIVEAGFVNAHSPFTIEIHGTEGTLLFGTPEEEILFKSNHDAEGTWQSYSIPDNIPGAFEQWVQHIQNGTNASVNIQMAIDLTKLMDAANQSASQGQSIKLG